MSQQATQTVIGAVTRYIGPNGVIRCGERVKIFQVMHGALLSDYDGDRDGSHSWCDDEVAAHGGVTKDDRIEVRVLDEDGNLSFSIDPRAIDLEMFGHLAK